MTPGDLLTAASELIARADVMTVGVWPRTSAFLARQALEQAIAHLFQARQDTVGLASCTMRSQLTCLPFYLDEEIAEQVAYTWAALSSACHYHPYELAPTAAELAGWIGDVGELIAHIAAGPPTS